MRSTPAIPRNCVQCGAHFLTWQYKIRDGEGEYCSRKCALVPKSPKTIFLKHVIKIKNSCWKWKGSTNKDGYSRFSSGSRKQCKTILAHRFSYELYIGPIPKGMFICHHCDNPPCTNPKHLFIGTNDDNMADMVSKNRKPRGENNTAAKLTDKSVKEIRQLKKQNWTISDISRKFSVSRATVRKAINKETWSHVS